MSSRDTSESSLRCLFPYLALAAVLISFGVLLVVRFEPVTVAMDANGYYAQGSLLATEGRLSFATEVDIQYVDWSWLVGADGRYCSRYPVGLPAVIACLYLLFGHQAGAALNPVLSILTLFGCFLVGKRLCGAWWGVLAAALVAWGMPIFAVLALKCDSHMAATCLTVWSFYWLIRWFDDEKPWQVFLSGLLLGMVPTVRYPETIFALPMVVALTLRLCRDRRLWRQVVVACLGAAIPLLPLLILNHVRFGAFWLTAYAYSGEQGAFGFGYLKQHALLYLKGTFQKGIGLSLILGVAGMATMAIRKRHRHAGLFAALLVVPLFLVYMSYYWILPPFGNGNLRFLLPAMCFLMICGVYLLSVMMQRCPRWVIVIVCIVFSSLHVLWPLENAVSATRFMAHKKKIVRLAEREIERHAKPGDVIIGHPNILQHLDYVRKWKLVPSNLIGDAFEAEREFWSTQRNNEVDTLQYAKWEKLMEAYGRLTARERDAKQAAELARWADGADVWYVGGEKDLEVLRGPSFWPQCFESRVRIPLPVFAGGRPVKQKPTLILSKWTPPGG